MYVAAVKTYYFLLILLSVSQTQALASSLQLTEKKVMALAASQNLQIQMSQLYPEIASGQVKQARSIFDTQLNVTGGYQRDKSDQSIGVFGTDNRTHNIDIEASQILPSGTQISAGWKNTKQKTNSAFTTINPYNETAYILSVRQPLLENFLGVQYRGSVTAAKKAYLAQKFQSEFNRDQSIFGAVLLYWEWIARKQNVVWTQRSLAEAREFETTAKQTKSMGLYDEAAILDAQSNRLRMEQEVNRAIQQRDESYYQLLSALNLPNETSLASNEAFPTSIKVGLKNESIQTALEKRQDYQAAIKKAEEKKVRLSMAKNAMAPGLDLITSLKLNGIEAAYSDSLSETSSADNPQFFIGGELSIPLQNLYARGQKQSAKAEEKIALLEIKSLENSMTERISTLHQSLLVQKKQVQLSNQLRETTRLRWQEELIKFKDGRSRSDLAVRAQEDHLASQRQHLSSLLSLRVLWMQLQLEQGLLSQKIESI